VQIGYTKLWVKMLFVVGFDAGVVLVGRGELTLGHAITMLHTMLTGFESIETLGLQWLFFVKGMVVCRCL
jgi:hypothetical protein